MEETNTDLRFMLEIEMTKLADGLDGKVKKREEEKVTTRFFLLLHWHGVREW